MESEHTAKTLQIALGSYDRKELRVEKNYLQEQSPALECTCFQNGGRLLEQLRQGRQFDVVILCSQLEDMSGLEFLMNIRSMDPKPNVVLFDEGRRQNTSAICLESGDGFCYVGHAELKNLLWELYRLPGRQSQRMERKCQELYEGWGIQLPDVNCNYLSCAVGVVYGLHLPPNVTCLDCTLSERFCQMKIKYPTLLDCQSTLSIVSTYAILKAILKMEIIYGK